MQEPQPTPDNQPPVADTGALEGVPIWHPKRWKDLPPNPPYGPIFRPDMVGKAGPTITIDPRIFPVAAGEGGQAAVDAPANTKWLLWLSGLLFFAVSLGFLYFLTYFSKPPADELSAYNDTVNPPATIAPSQPQEAPDDGQGSDGQDGQGGQGQDGQGQPGQDGQGGQDGQQGGQPGGGQGDQGQGGQDGQQGDGQGGNGQRPGAPGDGVQGKGPGAGSEGAGSGGQGGSDNQDGQGGSGGQGGGQGQPGQGGQGGGGGSQGGSDTQRPPRHPSIPDKPHGPPAPGPGGGQAAPTKQDPDRLRETPTEDTSLFMHLTLLPLGAEETGSTASKPAAGRVEQVNIIKLKNGKTIKVKAFRGTGTRKLIEEHRKNEALDIPVVYGDVLTRDSNPQLVGRMGADNELIGVLIEGDERIPVADLESIANGMRFDFD